MHSRPAGEGVGPWQVSTTHTNDKGIHMAETETSAVTNAPSIRVLEFVVENFGPIRHLCIRPHGRAVCLEGKNGAGKSSALSAFEWGIRGGVVLPDAPVRKGADKATVVIETPQYKIRRSVTKGGNPSLVVTGADGEKVANPQSVLNALWSHTAGDPIELLHAKPVEQQALAARAAGLTDAFAAIDAKRKDLYDRRTEANRELLTLDTTLKAIPDVDGPDQEVPLSQVMQELETVQQAQQDRAELAQKISGAKLTLDRITARKAELERELLTVTDSLAKQEAWIVAANEAYASMPAPNVQAVRDRMTKLDESNAIARRRKQRREVEAKLRAAREVADRLNRDIEDCDEAKRKAIASAKMPIAGMTFGEDGEVLFDGLPISKLSTAQAIRVCTAMVLSTGMALPMVLIRRGESLDSDSMAALVGVLEEHNAMALIERVRDMEGEPHIEVVEIEGGAA